MLRLRKRETGYLNSGSPRLDACRVSWRTPVEPPMEPPLVHDRVNGVNSENPWLVVHHHRLTSPPPLQRDDWFTGNVVERERGERDSSIDRSVWPELRGRTTARRLLASNRSTIHEVKLSLPWVKLIIRRWSEYSSFIFSLGAFGCILFSTEFCGFRQGIWEGFGNGYCRKRKRKKEMKRAQECYFQKGYLYLQGNFGFRRWILHRTLFNFQPTLADDSLSSSTQLYYFKRLIFKRRILHKVFPSSGILEAICVFLARSNLFFSPYIFFFSFFFFKPDVDVIARFINTVDRATHTIYISRADPRIPALARPIVY